MQEPAVDTSVPLPRNTPISGGVSGAVTPERQVHVKFAAESPKRYPESETSGYSPAVISSVFADYDRDAENAATIKDYGCCVSLLNGKQSQKMVLCLIQYTRKATIQRSLDLLSIAPI